ncbi:hypothetical protein CASFOL_015879 [Castilleja foliolosa]|uniref:F-box domain-containing protein n=1 Tax=Castilleja foliolosa TaxID=1961234 RepID=A0ABD3DF03_9LAMI
MEKKQRAKTEHNGSNSKDMISKLPQPILHHILSFLSKKCATQTSVLSKPWHQIWSSRPKIELCESDFPWGRFLSALDNIFQRYHDQNLSIQELYLEIVFDYGSVVSVLNKWMPIVKVFNLNLSLKYCHIPLSILVARSLKNLYMESCILSHQNPSSVGKFQYLQTLHLFSVYVRDDADAIGKMVSSCHRLKSLTLDEIKFSNDSLNFFSFNHLPNLEYLHLYCCYGFTEFHLFSRSIKHLIIDNYLNDSFEKATIHAPSILYFKYRGSCILSISFTTTNDHEWKSEIDLSFEKVGADSSWFVKLNKLLSALSRSEISLTLCNCLMKEIEDSVDDDDTRLYRQPVMVENLKLCLRPAVLFRGFIHNILFRVCHPRNIAADKCIHNMEPEHKEVNEVLYEILIMEREVTGHCLWRQDLEDVRVEAFDESGKVRQWRRLVQGTSLADHNNLCFRLKWS